MTPEASSRSPRPRLSFVLGRAALQPVSLGIAAGSLVLGAGLSSWALSVLGLCAYCALVAYDSFSPSFWRKVYAVSPASTVALPDPADIKDPGTRATLAALAAAKRDLQRVIRETPADVLANLATTIASLRELDGQVGPMVARAEDIAARLAVVNVAALKAESVQLGQRAAGTADAEAKTAFLEAKAARDDEIRTLAELRQAKDRVDATLSRLVAVVAGVATKIVHMRALDAQALDQMSGGLTQEIEAVTREVKVSEEIMKSLQQVSS